MSSNHVTTIAQDCVKGFLSNVAQTTLELQDELVTFWGSKVIVTLHYVEARCGLGLGRFQTGTCLKIQSNFLLTCILFCALLPLAKKPNKTSRTSVPIKLSPLRIAQFLLPSFFGLGLIEFILMQTTLTLTVSRIFIVLFYC